MYDPIVHPKSVWMQRVQDYVRYGYVYWTMGEVPLERARRLVSKFDDYYRVGRDSNARYQAKARGEGSARLLLYLPKRRKVLTWILLVSAGEHPAHRLERLSDARSTRGRITITGYELLRTTKSGRTGPVWTWRMTDGNYSSWRHRVIQTIRSGSNPPVQAMLAELGRSPGFHGIRVQVSKLHRLVRAEWRRTRKSTESLPAAPRCRYFERLRNDGIRLSALRTTRDTNARQQPAQTTYVI